MNQTLFPVDPITPPGFSYYPDFLSGEEENIWLQLLHSIDVKNMMFHGYEAKRKTAGFGYKWSFEDRTLSPGNEIPHNFHPLVEKAAAWLNIDAGEFASMLITQYPPGSVINWHRDAPPYGMIAGISFLSDCIFQFRPYDKAKQSRKSTLKLPLARRSLYLISGEARDEWEHSTQPLKEIRFSVTLRTLR
jgi:alkylated DNA repair dioxygenase AlkB